MGRGDISVSDTIIGLPIKRQNLNINYNQYQIYRAVVTDDYFKELIPLIHGIFKNRISAICAMGTKLKIEEPDSLSEDELLEFRADKLDYALYKDHFFMEVLNTNLMFYHFYKINNPFVNCLLSFRAVS